VNKKKKKMRKKRTKKMQSFTFESLQEFDNKKRQ